MGYDFNNYYCVHPLSRLGSAVYWFVGGHALVAHSIPHGASSVDYNYRDITTLARRADTREVCGVEFRMTVSDK